MRDQTDVSIVIATSSILPVIGSSIESDNQCAGVVDTGDALFETRVGVHADFTSDRHVARSKIHFFFTDALKVKSKSASVLGSRKGAAFVRWIICRAARTVRRPAFDTGLIFRTR